MSEAITDAEIFKAEIERAKQLGLDLNRIDLDALNDSIKGGPDFADGIGVLQAAPETGKDLTDAFGDDAFFALDVPKTGNKELDEARLMDKWIRQSEFNVSPTDTNAAELDRPLLESDFDIERATGKPVELDAGSKAAAENPMAGDLELGGF